ncbi:MAG: porin family protein [Hyphomicrobiales bacterium]|nr:porin family protein [Hyphomicrobiales bacterium]
MKNIREFARPTAAALGLLALLGTIPAYAADAVMEEPPAAPMEVPPLNTWSGPYAGVTVGYGFSGNTDLDTFGNEIGTDGFAIGAFGGYNYQVGNIVAGAEADIGYSWEDGSNAGFSSDSGLEGSLRARIGYVISPTILLYATAGGAAKDLEVSGGGVSDSNTMFGWTAGAGADMMFTDKVFGRVEYRYTDFGSDTFNTVGGPTEVSDTDNRITFGVGMKF